MSFARQRLYGTNHERPAVFPSSLPRRKIAARRISSRRLAAALKPAAAPVAAIALAASCVPAHAKSAKKLTGVWAWTSGSQTYIRARPSATTPPIAKVARHTKLFVWGKFDGWYRVETTDHKFGWIFNTYLHPSDEDKIAELSHHKAKFASDRTENQTMYGSAQMLKKHYARYGAEGARVGLQKQGVLVASTRAKAPHVALKKVAAKPTTKVAPRTIAAMKKNGGSRVIKVAAKAPIHTPRVIHPRSAGAAASTLRASTRGTVLRPVGVFPGAATHDDNRLNRSPDGTIDLNHSRTAPDEAPDENAPDAPSFDNASRAADNNRREAARRAAIRVEESRLLALRAENARLEKLRVQEQQRLTIARRDAQAKRDVLAQRDAEQNRLAQAQRAAENAANRRVAAQKAADNQRAAEQAHLYAARQKEAAHQANAARRRANYLARLKARQNRASFYASRKANEREAIRQRMGMVSTSPQAAEQGLRPLSPEELLRARDQYLSSRHKTRPEMLQPKKAPAKKSSASTRSGESLFEKAAPGSAFNNRQSALPSSALPETGATFQLTSYAANRSPFDAPIAAPKLCAPAAKPAAKAPAQNALNSRGGSPRDYLKGRNALGEGVATQALSYRGMPYIRGASSSKRGFDCSGLIYFLLRQRGYKPPRTAAELASYGTRVEKKDLQAGDILLFRNTTRRGGISHVGIYIGNGNFVHAANPRRGVRTDSLGGYYARKYAGARRVK